MVIILLRPSYFTHWAGEAVGVAPGLSGASFLPIL